MAAILPMSISHVGPWAILENVQRDTARDSAFECEVHKFPVLRMYRNMEVCIFQVYRSYPVYPLYAL